MKLVLGPENLQTELDFTIYKTLGCFTIVNGTITSTVKRVGVYLSGWQTQELLNEVLDHTHQYDERDEQDEDDQ